MQQDFFILNNAESVIQNLYGVGFLGIREPSTGNFIFCHDGRAPNRELEIGDEVLVHPCYWVSLNCNKNTVDSNLIEDIYDEYDIAITSETPKIRNKIIDDLVQKLKKIPEGNDGAKEFEEWCYQTIRICFAKGLRNVQLKPNRNAIERRDIVGTNFGDEGVWKRIYEDYGTRQVTFEVKNYKGLEASDYQQVTYYLSGDDEYGKFAVFITRDDSIDLYKNRDVEWVRHTYYKCGRKLIVKITGKYLCKLILKLKNTDKHDYVNDYLHKLLDNYSRVYLVGETMSDVNNKKKSERRRKKAEKTLVINT